MHCFKDVINNRKYFLHFIRLLLLPKSPILPNLGGYMCTYTPKPLHVDIQSCNYYLNYIVIHV